MCVSTSTPPTNVRRVPVTKEKEEEKQKEEEDVKKANNQRQQLMTYGDMYILQLGMKMWALI